METRIKKIETQRRDGDASDITNTYLVTDNGKEFLITFRSYRHGRRLGIAGQEGFLYRDIDANCVRRQVVSIGPACGVSIANDDVVEGLSPCSIQGVLVAEQYDQATEVILRAEGPEGSEQISVSVVVDGKVIDLQCDL
ncbi:MAG: hypothetical protein A4E57_04027 [Syntrophorhabdaceae bacterium PtaU1.Bin034]|nr:MAG: hypothetical protein A4E57_04027 [Syntrophorhabdaceae bacterium PtaU1.Bin034]